jgi:hypothetical protein
MTDRELLEAAAKAAGIEYDPKHSKPHPISGAFWGLWLVYHDEPTQYARRYFNPLTDDGDALRLAVKLRLDIDNGSPSDGNRYVCAYRCGIAMVRDPVSEIEEIEDECQRLAATRRAIVRAAAEIGAAIGEKAR